ncbi:hypothetical protein KUTeg_024088 [Tegillarca granosa]|uniref:Uncharacterized protein n=1 Tax=Tegillarca granosa TaxID=220873 RepID=A0ABQ9E0X8_TEGGR|nr:hypothetical protein KUTeg_024088 [Tegillarca granosa]
MYLFTSFFEYIIIYKGITVPFLLLIVIAVLWLHLKRPSDFPPGPPAFVPVLGNLIQFNEENFLLKLKECRRKYGDVFSLKMGSKLMVVLNGHETIKEALVKHGDVFSSRPDLFIFRETSEGQGIVGSSGDLWKDHRTFALTTLRSFGFGKRNLESKVMDEVNRLLKAFEDTGGTPYDITHVLHTSIANIVNSIVFGQGIFQENFKAAGVAGPLTFLPFLKHCSRRPVWG